MYAYCNNNPIIYIDPTGYVPGLITYEKCLDPVRDTSVHVYISDAYGDDLVRQVLNDVDVSRATSAVYISINNTDTFVEKRIYGSLGDFVTVVGGAALIVGATCSLFAPAAIPVITTAAVTGNTATVAGVIVLMAKLLDPIPDGTYEKYTVTASWVEVVPICSNGLTVVRQVNVSMCYWRDLSAINGRRWHLYSCTYDETQTNLY